MPLIEHDDLLTLPDPCPVCQRITDEQCGHGLRMLGELAEGTRIVFSFHDMYLNRVTFHRGTISRPPVQHVEVMRERRLIYVECADGMWIRGYPYAYLSADTLVVALP